MEKPWNEILYCPVCGGTDVQQMGWTNPNTGEFKGLVNNPPEEEDCWCENCEAHTKLKTLPELWKDFSKIPVNMEDETEEQFMMFPAGADRFDIWRWFDDRCEHGVHDDLMFSEELTEDGL